MIRRTLALPLLAVLVIGLTGCPKTESDARDAIAAAHGWITNAQATWGDSCRANASQPKCVSTNKLIAAQHTAADALVVYCSGPATAPNAAYANGGPCVPVKSAGNALVAAIQQMDQFMSDVKTLLGGN